MRALSCLLLALCLSGLLFVYSDDNDDELEIDLENLNTTLELKSSTYFSKAIASQVVTNDKGDPLILAIIQDDAGMTGKLAPSIIPKVLAPGAGTVVGFDPTGTKIISVSRVAKEVLSINSAVVDGVYRVVIGARDGIVVLNSRASRLIWAYPTSEPVRRVAIGVNGTVVGLVGDKTIHILSKNGKPMGSREVKRESVADVAVNDLVQSVYIVGHARAKTDLGFATAAFMFCWSYNFKLKWKNWDWTGHTLVVHYSDTELTRVTMGRDNQLYVLGQALGGKSVFRWGPRDINALGNLVENDAYTYTFDEETMYTEPVLYYARLDAENGDVLAAQLISTISQNGRGRRTPLESAQANRMTGAITASEDGHVYIAAAASNSICVRNSQFVNGKQVGKYSGPELSLIVLSPDFYDRVRWTVFTATNEANGMTSHALSVSAAHGVVSLVGECRRGKMILTNPLLGSSHETRPVAYLAVFDEDGALARGEEANEENEVKVTDDTTDSEGSAPSEAEEDEGEEEETSSAERSEL